MSEFELHVEDALDESLLRKLHQQKGTPGVLQRLIEMDFTTLGKLCNLESSLAKEFKIPIILINEARRLTKSSKRMQHEVDAGSISVVAPTDQNMEMCFTKHILDPILNGGRTETIFNVRLGDENCFDADDIDRRMNELLQKYCCVPRRLIHARMDSAAPDINDTVRFLVRYDVQQNQSTQVTVRLPSVQRDDIQLAVGSRSAKMADSVFNKMQSCFPSCLSTDPNGEMHVWCGLNDKGIPVGVNGILSSDDARDIARRFRGLPYFPPLTGMAIAFRVLPMRGEQGR